MTRIEARELEQKAEFNNPIKEVMWRELTRVDPKVNKFDNINIFLHRTKPYIAKGRNQTEEESIEFAKEMLELVRNYGGEFIELDAEQDVTSSKIIEICRNYDRADT